MGGSRVAQQQCKSLLNHVESTGGSRLGRVDGSREVMEEQQHKENDRHILWNLVEFRFPQWIFL